ncbi:hypothetical protein [Falsirhodobacter halotolerans]|uniref:hypothetical protein n=1 Tax=Falsirhodobacter halotolerans TaxID=1146892 RepID=UPI001FD19613|nr:hypothetical protein [Falsirhodobacter halotolerans]MCJ8139525.1 hypothetical protein [Falsirhodobacter halotolerans]
MHISFSPVRRDEQLTASIEGDILTLNGQRLDLSGVADGQTLPRSEIDSDWIGGPVTRVDGMLRITLILPHGADAPEETLFPKPVVVTEDGPIPLPPYDITPT